MPKTTDEFREVLRAFKKADLAGNGKTIPFAGFNEAPLDPFFMNAFLYDPGEPWLVVKDGKVDVTFDKDEWREGLKYVNGLYREGLISRDVFTADGDQLKRYGNAPGKPLIGGARSNYWGDFLDIDQKDPNARWRQYEACPPLKGPNRVRYAAWDYLDRRRRGGAPGDHQEVRQAGTAGPVGRRAVRAGGDPARVRRPEVRVGEEG